MAKGGVVAIGCGAVVLLSVLVLVATGVMLFIASAPPDGQEFEPEISSPQVTFPDGQPDIEAPAPESESEDKDTSAAGKEHEGEEGGEVAIPRDLHSRICTKPYYDASNNKCRKLHNQAEHSSFRYQVQGHNP